MIPAVPSTSTTIPAEPFGPIDPPAAALRARDEQMLVGNLQAANALSALAEAYVEIEALRRALAEVQTTERRDCIAAVDALADEFKRGHESDWEHGAREAASVLRGRR